jgi:hypothetical protein
MRAIHHPPSTIHHPPSTIHHLPAAFLLLAPVYGATWFVDPAKGDDGNPGKRLRFARHTNPLFPALRSAPPAASGASRQKQIPSRQPEFLLIPAGFDARVDDPTGGLRWTDETFAEMTRRFVESAAKWCGVRLVSVLEVGYNPHGLASAAVAHVYALARA